MQTSRSFQLRRARCRETVRCDCLVYLYIRSILVVFCAPHSCTSISSTWSSLLSRKTRYLNIELRDTYPLKALALPCTLMLLVNTECILIVVIRVISQQSRTLSSQPPSWRATSLRTLAPTAHRKNKRDSTFCFIRFCRSKWANIYFCFSPHHTCIEQELMHDWTRVSNLVQAHRKRNYNLKINNLPKLISLGKLCMYVHYNNNCTTMHY